MKTKGFILLLVILMLCVVTACGESTEETTSTEVTSIATTNDGSAPIDTIETTPKTESAQTTERPAQTTEKPKAEVTPSEGLRFAYNQETDSYYVSWLGNCSDTTIVVPTEYEKKAVSGFSPWALSGCNSFNAIVIPDTIVDMQNNVFTECENLVSIFCEAESQPAEWNAEWLKGCSATVYWGNTWHYVDGVPTLK